MAESMCRHWSRCIYQRGTANADTTLRNRFNTYCNQSAGWESCDLMLSAAGLGGGTWPTLTKN